MTFSYHSDLIAKSKWIFTLAMLGGFAIYVLREVHNGISL